MTKKQDRDADAYDAEQGVEGQGDGADREHHRRAEPPQRDQVAGERAYRKVEEPRPPVQDRTAAAWQ